MNDFEECKNQLLILVSNLKEVNLLPKDFSLASSSEKDIFPIFQDDHGEVDLCGSTSPFLNLEDSSS